MPAVGALVVLLTSTGATPESGAPVAHVTNEAREAPLASAASTGQQTDRMASRRAAVDRQVSRSAHRSTRTVRTMHAERVRAERARERVRQAARERAAERRREAAREAAHAWVPPLHTLRPTSSFGYRWGRLHAGEDFSTPIGTPVHAMSSGTVTAVTYNPTSGHRVEIEYWDGTVSYYFHLTSAAVAKGQSVAPGQVVAYSGNTGRSTGPHLHLEIHPGGGAPINPMPWLSAHGLL